MQAIKSLKIMSLLVRQLSRQKAFMLMTSVQAQVSSRLQAALLPDHALQPIMPQNFQIRRFPSGL